MSPSHDPDNPGTVLNGHGADMGVDQRLAQVGQVGAGTHHLDRAGHDRTDRHLRGMVLAGIELPLPEPRIPWNPITNEIGLGDDADQQIVVNDRQRGETV
jgi:hypothetical protein